MLVKDNGPQYDSAELSAFARSWCFEKVTSSPKLPKVFREYPALPQWGRTTTEGFGTIPAQRFMGRCSKTLWPTLCNLSKKLALRRSNTFKENWCKGRNNSRQSLIAHGYTGGRSFRYCCLETSFNPWRKDKSTSTGDRFQVCEQANQ